MADFFREPCHAPGLSRCGDGLGRIGQSGFSVMFLYHLHTSTYIYHAQFTLEQFLILILLR